MNLKPMIAPLSLILVIALTIDVKAEPKVRIIKNESTLEYQTIPSDPKLVSTIHDTIQTANWWHPLKTGNGAYTFSDLAKILQGPHLHLMEDTALVIKGTRKGVEAIKVKEVIVGLYKSEGKMIPNRFFAVTTEGKVVVLQLVSGHKVMTELAPQINKK